MRVLLTGFGPFPGRTAQSQRLIGQSARPPPTASVRRDHAHDARLCYGLRGGRSRPAEAVRAKAGYHSHVWPRRKQKPRLHRDPGAQRGFAVVSGCQRTLPRARRYRSWRTNLQGRAPFADLLGALRSSAIPARLSRDAGRYLCNYSYWRALDRAGNGHALVQFVHIPRVRFDPRRRRQSGSVFPSAGDRLREAPDRAHCGEAAAIASLTRSDPTSIPFQLRNVGRANLASTACSASLRRTNRAIRAAMMDSAARPAPSAHLIAIPNPTPAARRKKLLRHPSSPTRAGPGAP